MCWCRSRMISSMSPLLLSSMFSLLLCMCLTLVTAAEDAGRPHIVFIVADDLGYNDVPWHNALVRAPTLQRLAEQGVILEQNYVQPVCTPSRAAMLTGRYPFHLGRQHGIIWPLEPTGLRTDVPLVSEQLLAAGYRTHAVGKWHLGYCRPEYLPTRRGFQSFLGYWVGSEDYYSHTRQMSKSIYGLDFRRNETLAPQYAGVHSAEVFGKEAVRVVREHDARQPLFLYLATQNVHGPLQVPDRYQLLYPQVEDKQRRSYLALVSSLDNVVKELVRALHVNGLYNNTVIVFTTDNGGTVRRGGNNFPLRGNKATLWEGGTRGAAFVHSPLLKKSGYVSHALIHATDWLPTFLALAGVDVSEDVDGFNQWSTLSEDLASPRTELVYNIDVEMPYSAAIRQGDWKLMEGDTGSMSDWYPQPGQTDPWRPQHDQPRFQRLFNLRSDPLERNDMSFHRPDIVRTLHHRLLQLQRGLVPADAPHNDPAGNPNRHNHTFATGWCL